MLILLVENGLGMMGASHYAHVVLISALMILAVIAENYRRTLDLSVKS
jgi:ribose/xylose/arabinose/galactoside ABC-type transport system permease subunit